MLVAVGDPIIRGAHPCRRTWLNHSLAGRLQVRNALETLREALHLPAGVAQGEIVRAAVVHAWKYPVCVPAHVHTLPPPPPAALINTAAQPDPRAGRGGASAAPRMHGPPGAVAGGDDASSYSGGLGGLSSAAAAAGCDNGGSVLSTSARQGGRLLMSALSAAAMVVAASAESRSATESLGGGGGGAPLWHGSAGPGTAAAVGRYGSLVKERAPASSVRAVAPLQMPQNGKQQQLRQLSAPRGHAQAGGGWGGVAGCVPTAAAAPGPHVFVYGFGPLPGMFSSYMAGGAASGGGGSGAGATGGGPSAAPPPFRAPRIAPPAAASFAAAAAVAGPAPWQLSPLNASRPMFRRFA